MNPTIDMQAIRQLSVAERLQMIEDIWDTIATDPDSLPGAGITQSRIGSTFGGS